MSYKYILREKVAIPCADLLEWAREFELSGRHVAEDIVGDVRVSTVFLGIDHAFDDGPPLLFETMIFGGQRDQYQTRCSTWDAAEAQHAEALRLVKTAEATG